jgi:ADP-L-glycero-D-manno-heptose 6-epimerase
MRKMKILLTGHKGFIGSNMLPFLEREYDVDTFDWDDGYPKVKKYDWVIHLGAISSTTETNVEKIMLQNFDFSVELYKDCRHHQVNFQFASSASIYGLKQSFNEDDPVDPRTPYSWSKYMFEKYVMEHKQTATVQLFRYFNVYGPNEEHKGSQASPYCQFEKQAKETGVIKVFENSEKYKRDFIHVSQIITFHKLFMQKDVSGIFNLGNGSTRSFMDVAEQVARLYDAKIETIPMPENLKHSYQEYTCADMKKTWKVLESEEL